MDLLSFSSIYPEGPTRVILVHTTIGYNTSEEGPRLQNGVADRLE